MNKKRRKAKRVPEPTGTPPPENRRIKNRRTRPDPTRGQFHQRRD